MAFLSGKVVLAQRGERGVGLLAGLHVVADQQVAGGLGVEGVGLLVLVLRRERLHRAAFRVGLGVDGERAQREGEQDGERLFVETGFHR
jgi:hypothetical protein